jgi:hypothetical protein
MIASSRSSFLAQAATCWNWKCALMSAAARSLVYLAALVHAGPHGRIAIVLVEIAYVTLTAGVYAGMQQKALGLRSRLLGNFIVAVGVPALSQWLDWLAHCAVGAPAPARATVAVSVFACISALFHLYIMRRGVFLTGQGRSLVDDFRRIPLLVASLVAAPFVFFASLAGRATRAVESEAAL